MFFQFNHLSHLERVLYKLANKPHVVQHYVATTANGENRHEFSNRLSNDRMVSRLWLGDRDSTHRLNLFRQRRSLPSRINTGYPQNQHRLFPHGFRIARGLMQRSDRFTLRQSGGMEEEPPQQSMGMEAKPPTWLISALLFACAWVDTCHPCNCMHSFITCSFHLEVTCHSKRT
jgi:hypothetical protein